jgi:hypothetical protein
MKFTKPKAVVLHSALFTAWDVIGGVEIHLIH